MLADGLLKLLDPIGRLPRQVDVGASEVSVRGEWLVDRAFQRKAVDDRPRSPVEDLDHRVAEVLKEFRPTASPPAEGEAA